MPYTWRFDVVLENLPFLLAGLWRTCVLTLLAMMIGLILGLIVAIMRMAPWLAGPLVRARQVRIEDRVGS